MPDYRQPASRSTLTSSAVHSRGRWPVKVTLGLAVLGLLVAAAAFGMVQPAKTELPEQRLVTETLIIPIAQALSVAPENDAPYMIETRIESGDTVASILSRLNISEKGLIHFVTVDPAARAAYRLFPGRTVQAALDAEGGMKWIRYYHTPGTEEKGEHITRYLEVEKLADGYFEAHERTEQTESHTHMAAGVINSSLFGATDAANVPDGITLQMAEILGGKIDFLRDLRQGDEFRVIYETRMHDGRPAGSGRVLALEFINKGKSFEAVWFNSNESSGGYYDSEGKSLRGAFLRSAIPFSRISSRFGMRQHPIHRNWRAHNGIDFAAPTGTPIRATADGTVDSIGWQGGYGNTIVLRHPNNITTLYAHQSRFAQGLKRGDRVSQGEIIGYVGSTGWSTGPHLHYEFRIAGKPVDPLGAKLPEAVVLDDKQRRLFAQSSQPMLEQLRTLAQLHQENPAALTMASR
jgi:murein DD-endopeptidase MepM/ murein hydrolase activator NlpD